MGTKPECVRWTHPSLWLAGILCFGGNAAAQEIDFSPVTDPIGQYLAARPGVDGASLIVMQAGRVLHEQHWGSFTAQTSVPVASASKLLSGVAIMTLVDDGLIDLDAPVSAYLPAEFPAGTLKGIMTVRQMFSHTAGLPGQSQFISNLSITLQQAVTLVGQNTPLPSTPGTVFSYGGVSMHVAGRVAEVVTGQSWEALFHDRVVIPLGLQETDFTGLGVTNNPRISGGARSSAADMIRVLEMLVGRGNFRGTTVLSQQAVDTMLSDQTGDVSVGFLPTALAEYMGYGIGWWAEFRSDQTSRLVEWTCQGAFGTSPWVNTELGVYGVLIVDDALGLVDPLIDDLREFVRDVVPVQCSGDIADDFGTLGADNMVSFGDFLAMLGLVGPCPGGTPGCIGDIADDFGTLNSGDGSVSFGDFLALLGLVGDCLPQ